MNFLTKLKKLFLGWSISHFWECPNCFKSVEKKIKHKNTHARFMKVKKMKIYQVPSSVSIWKSFFVGKTYSLHSNVNKCQCIVPFWSWRSTFAQKCYGEKSYWFGYAPLQAKLSIVMFKLKSHEALKNFGVLLAWLLHYSC